MAKEVFARRHLVRVPLLVACLLMCVAGAGRSYTITGLEVNRLGDLVNLIVRADGGIVYEHFAMTDPDRIIIDFEGGTMSLPTVAYTGEDGELVQRVRTSQWRSDPEQPTGRVVVDLKEHASYSVGSEDSLLVVTIKPKAEKPSLEVVPAPKETVAPKRISIDVQEADIHTVLRSFSEFTGKSIVADKGVEGKITVSLKNVPWIDALDVILASQGLGFVELAEVIRVGQKEILRQEMLEDATADRKSEQLLPLITEIVPLNFAKADEMKQTVKSMLTQQRGQIEVDARTNSLLITDIQANLEKLKGLIRSLDSRTAQVEIVAKMVDVDYSAARDLGIVWDATGMDIGDQNFTETAGVDAAIGEVIGTFTFGAVRSNIDLDATLQTLESRNKANIISNPTITTVNNREANILVGKQIPLIVADEAGNAVVQLTTIGIGLRVTPHVNADSTITLDLHPEVSDLAAQATVQGGVIINTSQADTRVLVKDGDTVVIGGLIRVNESELKRGVPILKDIPLLGYLFSSSSTVKSKRELIIFVTPSILP